jgi:dTDP-4-amino-4,6-dideoxygalactose transaminase
MERNFGIAGEESTPEVGGNAKMNEFQAAMGLCTLRHIDDDIDDRKRVVETYQRLLADCPAVRFLASQQGVRSNYAYLPAFFASKAMRDQVYEALKAQDIYARKYFYPLVTDFECYQGRPGFDPALTPVAARLADTVLTLPLYPGLPEEDIQRICAIVRENAHE